jgi:hypothetical protein
MPLGRRRVPELGTNSTIRSLEFVVYVCAVLNASRLWEIAMTPTENLIAALGPWLDGARLHMDQEHLETYRACLQADGADVEIVIHLREGAIVLEAANNGRRLELYREDIQSRDAFGRPEALKWIFGKLTSSQP